MPKLTKKYKVVAKDKKMHWPLTEDGFPGEVYPGEGTIHYESNSYKDAQKFVEDNELVYEEPTSVWTPSELKQEV